MTAVGETIGTQHVPSKARSPQYVAVEELVPGDLIHFLGNSHRVLEVRPYVGSLPVYAMAVCEEGWTISLERGQCLEVWR